ncbi:C2 domain, partial [Dillenia turbinata]
AQEACKKEKGWKMDSPASPEEYSNGTSLMETMLGLLRVRVKRGINLAVRDVRSSDPYVVIKMGRQVFLSVAVSVSFYFITYFVLFCFFQKLKTRVMKKNINPEWNEDLTLCVSNPCLPIKLTVYDHDTFSKDDKMGDAEFDIKAFIDALKMHLEGLPSGTIITREQPSRNNCLAEESCITWSDGGVSQDICLRLRNVECGEVEIQLQWIDLPGCKGL